MRYYSSAAGAMALTADITAGATTLNVSSTAGLPVSFPYTLVLDVGQSTEEIVTVTAANGSLLTVSRGQDGSSAQSHSLGAVVRHMMTARDLREPQDHIAASAGVHGVTGSVVGTNDTQTLSGKTLASPTITGTATSGPWQARDTATANTVKRAVDVTAPANDVVGVKVTANSPLQTADLQQWSNTAIVTAAVNGAGRITGYHTNITVEGDAADTPAIKVPQETNGGRTVPQVDIDTRTDDTADIVQLKKNGTVVAKFDKDGNLTSPTVTSLQSADTGLDTRVTTIEGNLGSQTTFVASSSTKDGKRIHWGNVSVTLNGSGYATVTHGAGFTPTVVTATCEQAFFVGLDPANFTATTFQVRVLNTAGAPSAGPYKISYVCGE